MNQPRSCALGCTDANKTPYRAAPGLLVCHPCSDKLRTILATLERTYGAVTELDELIPGGRGGGVRTVPGPRSPAVDAILVHTDPRSLNDGQPAALATVESWARAVREDNNAAVPVGRITMARELDTLRFHWDWLMAQPFVDEFATDIRAVLQALRQVQGELDRITRVGKCPVVIVPGEWLGIPVDLACGASLRVRPGAAEITCRNCGEVWLKDRWHELGDGWADYATIAADLDVKVGTLWRWASEDRWRTQTPGRRRLVLRADAIDSYTRRRGALTFDQAG